MSGMLNVLKVLLKISKHSRELAIMIGILGVWIIGVLSGMQLIANPKNYHTSIQ
jgi:hypothetical protein